MVTERAPFDKADAPIYLAERIRREALMSVQTDLVKLTFDRENNGKLVFVTCRELSGLLLTHKHGLGCSVRRALSTLLHIGYRDLGYEAEVFLPEKLNQSEFEGVVRLQSRTAAE